MPTVKMLYTMRDVAGEAEVTVRAKTVKQLLNSLRSRYGAEFNESLRACKVTVNGLNIVGMRGLWTRLSDDDIVALVPPMLGKQAQ